MRECHEPSLTGDYENPPSPPLPKGDLLLEARKKKGRFLAPFPRTDLDLTAEVAAGFECQNNWTLLAGVSGSYRQ